MSANDPGKPTMAKKKSANKSSPKPTTIYQFKLTLLGIQSKIWRRIQISDCKLHNLHLHIQAARGWRNPAAFLLLLLPIRRASSRSGRRSRPLRDGAAAAEAAAAAGGRGGAPRKGGRRKKRRRKRPRRRRLLPRGVASVLFVAASSPFLSLSFDAASGEGWGSLE